MTDHKMAATTKSMGSPGGERLLPGIGVALLLALGLGLLWQAPAGAAAGGSAPGSAPGRGAGQAPAAGSLLATATYSSFLPLIPNAAYDREPVFGIETSSAGPALAGAIADLGARWVRVPFHWDSVEPANTTPDHYRWPTGLERQLIALSAQHVRVILLFCDNPVWAATFRNGPIDLAPVSEVAELMQAAAARYSRPPFNIQHWEMYNEPDGGDELAADFGAGYFGHTPQAYVDILQAVYGPVKAVAPNVHLLLGGLAYDRWEEDGGPFVRDFLDRVLELDGGASIDVLSFHYYQAFDDVWAPYGHGILGKLAYLRDLAASFDVEKTIVCTETGWPTDDGGPGTAAQSNYAVQLYARTLSVDLPIVVWYSLIDDGMPGVPKYGLLKADMTPKPAYYAWKTATRQLARARYARTWTAAETGSDQIEAYEYGQPADQKTLLIAWANDVITHPLTIDVPVLEQIDKGGNSRLVYDGDDYQLDGRVTVGIGPSPLLLRYAPIGRAADRQILRPGDEP